MNHLETQISRFLEYLLIEKKYSNATISSYQNDLNTFSDFCNQKKKDLDSINKEDLKDYEKGLEKTRKEFVSKLNLLGIKYTKIDDEYFEELEQLLIMADIGVNTVMNFMDRLKSRVKSEHITDTKTLNEVIIDEFI